MALVTDAEVKAVVDTTRDTTPFIATADLLVTEDLAGSGLSNDRLKQVELYLAAHYVAVTEERGGLLETETGDSSERYADVFGDGLNMTRFGQMAISLDTSGTLATLATSKQKAELRVV